MKNFLASSKSEISAFLNKFLAQKKEELSTVNHFSEDSFEYLLNYSKSGKMIRGALLLLTASFYENEYQDFMGAAAALELIQSSLLMHDDIMDQDSLRRGKPTAHVVFETHAKNKNWNNTKLFGESMAICLGDIGFFLAFELLSSLSLKKQEALKLIYLSSREFTKVGLAQMQDVVFSSDPSLPQKEAILNLYRYKTARYTFSLPLMAGAVLSNAGEDQVAVYEKLGESLGLLFQIKDDEIEIFGDQAVLGKSLGSDIKEGKKTLYYYYLFSKANESEKEEFSKIFNHNSLTDKDFLKVKNFILEKGIQSEIQALQKALYQESEQEIEKLNLDESKKELLLSLLSYNYQRTF